MRQSAVEATRFVGRSAELGQLQRCWQGALEGHGQVTLLYGEPGIGKSRLARELARWVDAGSSGLCGWGRTVEGLRCPALWPWGQALQGVIDAAGWDALGEDTQRLLRTVPALHGVRRSAAAEIGAAEISATQLETIWSAMRDPAQEGALLLEAAAELVQRSAGESPVLIIIEDLQWADRLTLKLLGLLVYHLEGSRILVLATYRDTELYAEQPLLGTLAALAAAGASSIALQGIGQAAVAQLAAADGVEPHAVADLVRRAGGNPLFAIELLRLARATSPADSPSSARAVAPGIRATIEQRLQLLPPVCADLLQNAAMLGRSFSAAIIADLSGRLTALDVARHLRSAVRAGIIEELDQLDHYQFTHALIQEVLEANVPRHVRARAHAHIAQVLERRDQRADRVAAVAELAYHYGAARSLLGTAKFVEYAELAAREAFAARAFTDAERWCGDVLASLQQDAPPRRRAALLELRARCLLADGSVEDGFAALADAFELYDQSGDTARMVAIGTYALRPVAVLPEQRLLALNDRAAELAAPGSVDEALVLVNRSRVLSDLRGDCGQAREARAAARAAARRAGNRQAELQIVAESAFGEFFCGDWSACIALARELIATAGEAADHDLAYSREVLCRALLITGQPAEALEQVQRSGQLFRALNAQYRMGTSGWLAAIVDHLRGRFTAALEAIDALLDRWPQDGRYLCTKVLLETQVGNREEAETHLARLLDVLERRVLPDGDAASIVVLTLGIVTQTWPQLVPHSVAAQVCQIALSRPRPPLSKNLVAAGLALLELAGAYQGAVADSYRVLLAQRGTLLWFGLASADRVLALIALAAGRVEAAVEHAREAVQFCTRAGYGPEVAWCQYTYAAALHAAAPGANNEEALQAVAAAGQLCRQYALQPLADLAARLHVIIANPDGLTAREREVLQHIAAGRTNQEIGVLLGISDRTVANHAAKIYAKTGAANRAEAATYAARHGVT